MYNVWIIIYFLTFSLFHQESEYIYKKCMKICLSVYFIFLSYCIIKCIHLEVYTE